MEDIQAFSWDRCKSEICGVLDSNKDNYKFYNMSLPHWQRVRLQKQQELHEKRVREVKPVVDCTRSKTSEIISHRKIEQRLNQRKIEVGNQKMVDRINFAMKKSLIDTQSNYSKQNSQPSFILSAKKREIDLINSANEKLLHRIQSVKSCYSRENFILAEKRHQSILRTMSNFQSPSKSHNSFESFSSDPSKLSAETIKEENELILNMEDFL